MKFPEKSGGGVKNLVKLKAGESIIGVFRGDPHVVWKHWENNRGYLCTGPGCEPCTRKKASYRLQVNFVTKENGVLVAKVFEQGYRFQKTLEALNSEYPLESHMVKITRTGNGTDTSYSVMPVQNSLLTKKLEAEIAKVELNALGPVAEVGAALAKTATDTPDDEEGDASFDVA